MVFDSIYTTLELLGLNENEQKVYVDSLSLGAFAASTLSKRIGLHRSTTQYTCDSLVRKGLLSVRERKNTKIYTAEDPNKLIAIINTEQSELNRKKQETHKTVQELQKLMLPENFKTEVKYYFGPEEVIGLINEVFESSTPMYGVFSLWKEAHPIVKNYFNTEYRKRRDARKLQTFALINYLYKADDSFTHIDEREYKMFLDVDENIFPFEWSVHLYDWRVAFYTYTPTDVTGVLIKSEILYKTMLSIFRMAWNFSRKSEKNMHLNAPEL